MMRFSGSVSVMIQVWIHSVDAEIGKKKIQWNGQKIRLKKKGTADREFWAFLGLY